MFTPTLHCECAQPASDRLMRKWCIGITFEVGVCVGAVWLCNVCICCQNCKNPNKLEHRIHILCQIFMGLQHCSHWKGENM